MTKIVFFATPEYAIPVLAALKNAGYELTAVVTQPPAPVGREQRVVASPVALWAQKQGIKVLDTPAAKLAEPLAKLHAEVGVLGAYGRLIPPQVLQVFPHGIINVHPSLLPRWRGASPVEATIASGDKVTGVTIMKLDEELDHGPILAQFEEEVLADDTKGTLRERLFAKAAGVLPKILPDYVGGRLKPKEQEHQKATLTTKMEKDHAYIPPEYVQAALQGLTLKVRWKIPFIRDFTHHPSPITLERFIRALYPWPGAWTMVRIQEKRLKILKAHLEDGKLLLDKVQLEGKNPVSFKQLLEGYPALASLSALGADT